jgi:hypothetical protein
MQAIHLAIFFLDDLEKLLNAMLLLRSNMANMEHDQ